LLILDKFFQNFLKQILTHSIFMVLRLVWSYSLFTH